MEILVNFDDYVGKFMLGSEKRYRSFFKSDAKFSNRYFRTYTLAKQYHDKVVDRHKKLVLAAAGM